MVVAHAPARTMWTLPSLAARCAALGIGTTIAPVERRRFGAGSSSERCVSRRVGGRSVPLNRCSPRPRTRTRSSPRLWSRVTQSLSARAVRPDVVGLGCRADHGSAARASPVPTGARSASRTVPPRTVVADDEVSVGGVQATPVRDADRVEQRGAPHVRDHVCRRAWRPTRRSAGWHWPTQCRTARETDQRQGAGCGTRQRCGRGPQCDSRAPGSPAPPVGEPAGRALGSRTCRARRSRQPSTPGAERAESRIGREMVECVDGGRRRPVVPNRCAPPAAMPRSSCHRRPPCRPIDALADTPIVPYRPGSKPSGEPPCCRGSDVRSRRTACWRVFTPSPNDPSS